MSRVRKPFGGSSRGSGHGVLFSPKLPSFAAFFEHEFWPSVCFGGRHSPLPVRQLLKGHEGLQI
jgi:hypothetical protein